LRTHIGSLFQIIFRLKYILRVPRLRLRIEYSVEGGESKALELYAVNGMRELTYEAIDEVLKADISKDELAAITRLLNGADLTPEHVPCALADAIDLSYETASNQRKSFWGEKGSQQFAALLDIWIALEHVARRYFIPRFY
jgi:hypothetical protein